VGLAFDVKCLGFRVGELGFMAQDFRGTDLW